MFGSSLDLSGVEARPPSSTVPRNDGRGGSAGGDPLGRIRRAPTSYDGNRGGRVRDGGRGLLPTPPGSPTEQGD